MRRLWGWGQKVIDIAGLLDGLAIERPVFHSEADFQLGLGIQIAKTAGTPVRLEYRPFRDEKMYLDVYLPMVGVAMELKYKTQWLEVELKGEPFVLTYQKAHDNARYDFLRDVQRLEHAMKEGSATRGVAVLLTNDPLYWSPPARSDTADADFQLGEGRVLRGELAWKTVADRHGRKEPIRLRGSYELRWRDYADVASVQPEGEALTSKHGRFRYLAVELAGSSGGFEISAACSPEVVESPPLRP